MSNRIPFSILFENQNIDFFFDSHSESSNPEHVTNLASKVLDLLDKDLKNNKISDGDTWDLESFHEIIGAPKVKESMSPQEINQMYTDAFTRYVRDKAKAEALQTYRDYRNGRNNCLNFQLQSLAAAVVNRAALQINRKAKELGIDAMCQAQVHDQLIINCDKKDVAMFAPIVQEIMENTTKLPGVTLKAPPEISDNWRDGH